MFRRTRLAVLLVFATLAVVLGSSAIAVAQTPECPDDPSRTLFAGRGRGPCTQFHGDISACESAYYVASDGDVNSCVFVEGTCAGCGGANRVCGLNTCDGRIFGTSPVQCDGDPDRSAFLGRGDNGSKRCRGLDGTGQATCENAFYEDDTLPVSCWWDSAVGACRGCGGNGSCPENECAVDFGPEPTAVCGGERTVLVGFGSDDDTAPCNALRDEMTCEESYYEAVNTGDPIACWWDGEDCRGSGFGSEYGYYINNVCFSFTRPVADATCPREPDRELLGIRLDETRVCRQFDGTSQETCENYYYQNEDGLGVACWWHLDTCLGSASTFDSQNACQLVPAPLLSVCEEDRTLLGFGEQSNQRTCRSLDGTDQGTCEGSYYQSLRTGIAVGCSWDGGECRGCSGRNLACTDNRCLPEATCPGRSNYIGIFGNRRELGEFGGACNQFDNTTDCEDAFYFSGNAARVVGCWWDDSTSPERCRGSSRRYSDENECLGPASAECTLEANERTILLGFGANGTGGCRSFDGDQAMCEMAYYEHLGTGQPAACWWQAAGELCGGSGGDNEKQNACLRTPKEVTAVCVGDPNRTMSVGFGGNEVGERGGACPSLTTSGEAVCNTAFYEDTDDGHAVACWWDSDESLCRGSASDYIEQNACIPAIDCPGDPSRQTQLPDDDCDDLDETECNDAYYREPASGVPASCLWIGGRCTESDDFLTVFNECLFTPPVAEVPCDATPARTMLLGFGQMGDRRSNAETCRALDDTTQELCESAYYESFRHGTAVSCYWDGDDCRGTGSRSRAARNACTPVAECPREPQRSNVLGYGDTGTGVCRQLDGTSAADCENAFYLESGSNKPVACWWDVSGAPGEDPDCRGSNDDFERFNACLRDPLPPTATCEGRSLFVGFGQRGTGGCRSLDDTSAELCESAFYEGVNTYGATSCMWDPPTNNCYGTSRWSMLNECDGEQEVAECTGNTDRTLFAGKGRDGAQGFGETGGACRQFSDMASCDSAYYVDQRNQPVACVWTGDCMGAGGHRQETVGLNECVATERSCEGRPVFLGARSNSQCSGIEDEAVCNMAFYVGFDDSEAISCQWSDEEDECQGCGPNRRGSSDCTENACGEAATCPGDPGRPVLARCREIQTESLCNQAFHMARPRGALLDAAACFWDSQEQQCRGCGPAMQRTRECTNTCRDGCGNGVIDPGEECDDGNLFNGDCCDESCQAEPDGSTCADHLFCTQGAGSCDAGACVGAEPRECASCLANDCDELGNRCESTASSGRGGPLARTSGGFPPPGMSIPLPEGTECDDGIDGTETACSADGMCTEELTAPLEPQPAPAPAMGLWGYAAVLLVLIGFGAVSLRRRET